MSTGKEMAAVGYSIKTMAQKCGLSEHTLRYYEKEGLLPHVNRDDKGNRCFADEDLDWIALVCCLRDTGMSISGIRRFVELSRSGDATLPDRKRILQEHRKYIRSKIRQFRKYAEKIDHKIAWYATLEAEAEEKAEHIHEAS